MGTQAVVFLDAETTRLDRRRQPWEIAMIRRNPRQGPGHHRVRRYR